MAVRKRGEAHKVLGLFENALRDFELEINPEKVEMLSGPSAIEGAWLYRFRDIQKKEGIKGQTRLPKYFPLLQRLLSDTLMIMCLDIF